MKQKKLALRQEEPYAIKKGLPDKMTVILENEQILIRENIKHIQPF